MLPNVTACHLQQVACGNVSSDLRAATLRELPVRLANRIDWRRFWPGESMQDAPSVIHRCRVYILPTRFGVLFAEVLLVTLVGSINDFNSLGHLLTLLTEESGNGRDLSQYVEPPGLAGPIASAEMECRTQASAGASARRLNTSA